MKGKPISPATLLIRTVWGIITPFHEWGYVKWRGEKVPVRDRGACRWDSFNTAMDTDWETVPREIRRKFERDLKL